MDVVRGRVGGKGLRGCRVSLTYLLSRTPVSSPHNHHRSKKTAVRNIASSMPTSAALFFSIYEQQERTACDPAATASSAPNMSDRDARNGGTEEGQPVQKVDSVLIFSYIRSTSICLSASLTLTPPLLVLHNVDEMYLLFVPLVGTTPVSSSCVVSVRGFARRETR